MKKLIFITLLVMSATSVKAQYFSDQITSQTWDLIGEMQYKPNAKGDWMPVFPPNLKALNNKVIELPGYMIPIASGMTHNKFLLSVLPYSQCSFCGQDGIPVMVEVRTKTAIRYTDEPLKLKGKLLLNSSSYSAEVSLLEAEVIKK